VIFALVARLGAVAALLDPGRPPYRYEHGEIAANLLAGRGFAVRFLGAEGPTSQQAPFYPALLAVSDWLWGPGSPRSSLAIELAQAVAGAATALGVAWLGWLLFPRRRAIGWIGAALFAAHPAQIYAVAHLQVAVWVTLALVLLLCCCLATRDTLLADALNGFLSGGLLLIEPILVVAVPVVALLLAGKRRGWEKRLRAVAFFAAAVAAALFPWLLRNYRVHGEFVFVKSTLGYAFWQGNNDHSWGTDKVPKQGAEVLRRQHDGSLRAIDRALWQARHETLYIDDVALTDDDYRTLARLSEPARSRLLARRALAELSLGRYLALCANRLRYFLLFDATHPKAANGLYRAASFAWLATFAFGLSMLRGHWRPLWPVLSIFLLVTLVHTLVITAPRFRIPIEALTYPCCAAGIVAACDALRTTKARPGECGAAKVLRTAGHVA
jgi:4-amino-4-deoxy-L-arabinose transferase-like glycosyltransferase